MFYWLELIISTHRFLAQIDVPLPSKISTDRCSIIQQKCIVACDKDGTEIFNTITDKESILGSRICYRKVLPAFVK